MISEEFARQQVNRMQGLPYFSKIGRPGYAELCSTLARTAQDEREAEAAISALLNDEARSQNREMDKVPSPGELRQWVLSQRAAPVEQQVSYGQHCDRCRNGRPPGWVTHMRTHRGQQYEYAGKCPACNPQWYGKTEN